MIRPRPITNGSNGRGSDGRFRPGNRYARGHGNPHAAKVVEQRKTLFAAVTEEDIKAVLRMLVEEAKKGNVHAARELLSRIFGNPVNIDIVEQVEQLREELLALRAEKNAGQR